MNVVIILLVVFVLIVTSFLIVKFTPARGYISPPDTGGGNNLENCKIYPLTELKKCDPTDNAACIYCNGGFSCVTVSDDNPQTYSPDGGKTTLQIPNGSWCLPAKFASANCDPYISTPILTKLDNGTFMWRCNCKYPYLFENVNVNSDCSKQIACGNSSDPSLSLGKLVCPNESKGVCTPGEEWTTSSKWDPQYGVCECKSGYTYQDQSYGGVIVKSCVDNSCNPGQPTSSGCVCPTKIQYPDKTFSSWVRCPQDVEQSVAVRCEDLGSPQCLPDPCNPNGYWNGQSCVCNNPFTPFQVDVQESVVGWQCKNLCDNNGPCGSGSERRGDCFVPQQADQAQCNNCVKGWTNKDGGTNTCNDMCIEDNGPCNIDDDCCGSLNNKSSYCKLTPHGSFNGVCTPIIIKPIKF